ncbi:MAG: hypothetical protein ACWGSQ_06100 [Longimicrobiales bacterium]
MDDEGCRGDRLFPFRTVSFRFSQAKPGGGSNSGLKGRVVG